MDQADVEAIEAFAERMAALNHACERFAAWTAALRAAAERFRVLGEVGRWPR
jgi:hypothetical protein